MYNPYNPSMEEVKTNYEALMPPLATFQKKLSLIHPYKTLNDVKRELKTNYAKDFIFSKMSKELVENREAMLELVKEHPKALLYTSNTINDLSFKQEAIKGNPLVYSYLYPEDKRNNELMQTYAKSMEDNMKIIPIDPTLKITQYPYQFDEDVDLNYVFSNREYKERYNDLIERSPYKNETTLTKNATFIATAKLLCPEREQTFNDIEKEVWLKHENKVKEMLKNTPSTPQITQILEALEEKHPALKEMIEQDYIKEKEFDKEIEIKLEKQEEYIREEREEINAFLMQDSIDRVYSAAAIGDIDFSMASNIAANISNTPTKSKASVSRNEIERFEGVENDIDNLDLDREIDLERYYDDTREEIEQEEIEEEIQHEIEF